MVEVKPFTKFDWYGWAGATPPNESTEPYIGYARVLGVVEHSVGEPYIAEEDGTNATVILDKNGVSINFSTDGGYAAALNLNCSFDNALLWAKILSNGMTLEDYEFLGFEFTEY